LYLVSAVLYKGVKWDLANVALKYMENCIGCYKACTLQSLYLVSAVLYKDLYLYSNGDGSPPSAHIHCLAARSYGHMH
jgi:hypothetical protein